MLDSSYIQDFHLKLDRQFNHTEFNSVNFDYKKSSI